MVSCWDHLCQSWFEEMMVVGDVGLGLICGRKLDCGKSKMRHCQAMSAVKDKRWMESVLV